jgi:hypothetical protein
MMKVKKAIKWAALPGMLMWLVGCSSFESSYGVSPATFLLPGLMQAPAPVGERTNLLVAVAQPELPIR